MVLINGSCINPSKLSCSYHGVQMLHIAGIPFKGYCDMKSEGGGKELCKLLFKKQKRYSYVQPKQKNSVA